MQIILHQLIKKKNNATNNGLCLWSSELGTKNIWPFHSTKTDILDLAPPTPPWPPKIQAVF